MDIIHRYALFLGYLAIATRGLGLLVVMWTTVVLLGGFVSVLGKKDFWCLTVITLVQTLGVYDFLFKEKASDIVNALGGLLVAVHSVAMGPFNKQKCVLLWYSICLGCTSPLEFLYVGSYIEHDYGDIDGAANLRPALNVLYSLAVAQGAIFSYKTIYELAARTRIVERVAELYSLDQDVVSEYLDQTVTGCVKDPSFAKGRNLVTYAVDLMESKPADGYVSGVLILGTILQADKPSWDKEVAWLTGSASFRHVMQRLSLEILRPKNRDDAIKIRKHATSILVHVADSIFLEQLPGGIQLLSALLDTFEEYSWCHGGNRGDYNWFVVQGLRILQKLAIHESNCTVISHTEGLPSKAMAPLISEQYYSDSHDEWCCMAQESMELMRRLVAAPGETGRKLKSEISGNMEASIGSLKKFLECPRCEVRLKRHAVMVLLDLSVDISAIMASGNSSIMFSWILLYIFVLPDDCFGLTYASMHQMKRSSDIRRLAGEKLLAVVSSQSEGFTSTNMPQAVVFALTSLTRTIVGAENPTYSRLHALEVLDHLCRYDTEYVAFIEDLKKAMVVVMPEVLKEILVCGTTGEELKVVTEASSAQLSAAGTNLEDGGVTQGNIQESVSSLHQNGDEQHEDSKLLNALISLCSLVCDEWIGRDEYLTTQLDDITAKICSEWGMPVETFASIVKKLQWREI